MRSIDVGFLDRDPVEVVGSHAEAEAVEVGEAEASVAEARLRRVLCPGVEELARPAPTGRWSGPSWAGLPRSTRPA